MAEKTPAEVLGEQLLIHKEHAAVRCTDEQIAAADAFCKGYKSYLDTSKTEREAVTTTIALAEAAGFTAFDKSKTYQPGDKVYYNNHGKSICLAVIGRQGTKNGVKIAAAHIDSPRLDLKPIPLYEANEMALLKTHYYGGVKKYQWTAMPLAMHGVVSKADGTCVEVKIGEDDQPADPKFCVTDLLPHLAQEQMTKTLAAGIAGEDLNILVGSRPVCREKGENRFKLNVLKALHDKYGITESDLMSAEIEFVPSAKAADIGFDRSLIGSYGHDDRVCAYPSVMAALDCGTPESTVVTVLADKEEIGSVGNTGLDSNFLCDFIEDLADLDGVAVRDVMRHSECLSADVCAAYDPTYASAYEANNSCYVNYGVGVMKYTGSRGKGGSNDASAEYTGKVRRLFDKNNVQWQIGELGRIDLGGGGTVALYISGLGADVIDVGVPVLSMHAPYEVVAKSDVYMLYLGVKAFFEQA